MEKFLLFFISVCFTGCSSIVEKDLNIEFESNNKSNLSGDSSIFTSVSKYPEWVVSDGASVEGVVGIRCVAAKSANLEGFEMAKYKATEFAKADLMKNISRNETIFANTELRNEEINEVVKSNSSGYIGEVDVQNVEAIYINESYEVCVSVKLI